MAALLVIVVLAALASAVDWHPVRPARPPRVLSHSAGQGQLSSGSAEALIDVPFPAVTAGYGPRDRHSATAVDGALAARAVALEVGGARATIASVDLLEVDDRLVADVEAALAHPIPNLWVCATHTHSGMGGYDPGLLAQIAGTGRYSSSARAALVRALAKAVDGAQSALSPSAFELGQGSMGNLVENRDRSGPVEDRLIRWMLSSSTQLTEIALLSAHPTLVWRDAPNLSADFPGVVAFDIPQWTWPPPTAPALGKRMGMVLQGAVGDASIRHEVAADPVAVDQALKKIWPRTVQQPGTTGLDISAVEVELPPPQFPVVPRLLRRVAHNLGALIAPSTAQVAVLRLGALTLAAVPGEATYDAEQILLEPLRRQAAPGQIVTLAGLCNGYVGYVDSAAHVTSDTGEADRTYFGPALVDRLRDGLAAAPLSPP